MEYKKKKILLLSLIAALGLTYTISIVFSPEFMGSRSASFIWLDSRLADRIARIAISSQEQDIELFKRGSQWFVAHNNREYPARHLRVEDFIAAFTTRASWSVRSSSAASHQRLGLDEESASRVAFFGENAVLLDVLLGGSDITGREIYLRKAGQNEVRSGDNLFSFYLRGGANSWFNLRLIPESEDGRVAVDTVMRLTVINDGETQVFSRRNREWIISGVEVINPDQGGVDGYVRAILNAEGDDFIDLLDEDVSFDHSRITLELGTGGSRTIRFTEPDETGRRLAIVDGVDFIYSIAPWTGHRLFRSAQDFERQ
jgi:hypothetical protein